MAEKSLEVIEKLDPAFGELIEKTRSFALSGGGALPEKIKLLIALALDASHGAVSGVRALAQAALAAGATRQEIAETLRVAQYVSGAGAVYTAAAALKDLFS